MKVFLFIGLYFSAVFCFGQQTINDTLVHDDLQRSYILYVPDSYSSEIAAPLVINFHGYTSTAFQQMLYGDFREIADTAGFLLVHPMGTLDNQGQPYWNAEWGGSVDDIGFTEALIDSLAAAYNIDLNRVFCTGMSNGGFMSYTLACRLSHRIAAIASVTGTMNVNQTSNCTPQHPVPLMEIHGTADDVVPYNGIPGVMESIENTLAYWIDYNQCDATASITNVPDINILDGCTAVLYQYLNGENDVEVAHYKIVDGGHTWPGAPFVIGVTNYDIDASQEIWEFFSKFDINGRINPTSVAKVSHRNFAVQLFPNPAGDFVNVAWDIPSIQSLRIVNSLGIQIVTLQVPNESSLTIPLGSLQNGMYFLQFFDVDKNLVYSKKFLK